MPDDEYRASLAELDRGRHHCRRAVIDRIDLLVFTR